MLFFADEAVNVDDHCKNFSKRLGFHGDLTHHFMVIGD